MATRKPRTREESKTELRKRTRESAQRASKNSAQLIKKGTDPTQSTLPKKRRRIKRAKPPLPIDAPSDRPPQEEPQEKPRWPWRRKAPDGSWIPETRLPLTCEGPRKRKCKKCEDFNKCQKAQLTYWTPIPQYIFDNMNDISLSAQKIFLTINRLVGFSKMEKAIYYNKWWGTYQDLTDLSGVKSIGKYVKELRLKNYITHKQVIKKESGRSPITLNEFQVRWRIDAEKLDLTYDKRGTLF